jgi:lysozyme family protein
MALYRGRDTRNLDRADYPVTFARAVAYVLRPDVEGRLEEDPQDPGGVTHFGISQKAYPKLDVRALTSEQAEQLYHQDYWLLIQGDQLPDPIGFALFDLAVNSGVTPAIRLLQRVLDVTADGLIGAQTLHVAQTAAAKAVVRDLSEERLALMASQPNYAHDGKGWRRRVIQTAIEAFQ